MSDPKYFGETFKIYWTRGKKKIDTRKGVVKPDTQTARFGDKFQMKTVLQYDEPNDEFKPKPSILQLVQLEKKPDTEQDQGFSQKKAELTGNEIEIGQILVDLAQYARYQEKNEKL